MNLRSELLDDMKAAMKDRENGKLRLAAIRMAVSNIKNVEIDKKRELTEDEIVALIAKEVKIRKDAIEEFQKAGRNDLASQYSDEIEALKIYLPEQLGADEIAGLVKQCIEKSEAATIKEIGKVMTLLMPLVKGRADGKLVNQIVREQLK